MSTRHLGKRRLKPEPTPQILPACPEPPPWLSAYAREERLRVARRRCTHCGC
jgi:hypothetical protein